MLYKQSSYTWKFRDNNNQGKLKDESIGFSLFLRDFIGSHYTLSQKSAKRTHLNTTYISSHLIFFSAIAASFCKENLKNLLIVFPGQRMAYTYPN
jgi:hypothetical protein